MRTVAEVASHFGVSRRTIHEWVERGCPAPATREAMYDLDAISGWRAANVRPRPGADGKKAKRLDYWRTRNERAKALAAEESLKQQQGDLVETEFVCRLLTRHVATHNALFEQLADRVLSLLPARFPAADRRRVNEGVTKLVTDLRQQMAELIEEWEQELRERIRETDGEAGDEATGETAEAD